MERNTARSNGLSERAKSQISEQISSLIIESLQAGFSKLSENDLAELILAEDDEILAAFPAYRRLCVRRCML
jgi:hypothetical protein